MRNSLSLLMLAALVGCGGGPSRSSQQPPVSPLINLGLATPALSGQKVAVLPLTLAIADTSLMTDPLLGDRTKVLPWADSLIGETFLGRAPEVTWVLPAELRRMSRRSAGYIGDPDHFAHALLRDSSVKVVPDPLRSQIRALVAVADTRYALAPTVAVFLKAPDGIKVEQGLVLIDARTGMVIWRSIAEATGSTYTVAYRAAMAHIIPVQGVQ